MLGQNLSRQDLWHHNIVSDSQVGLIYDATTSWSTCHVIKIHDFKIFDRKIYHDPISGWKSPVVCFKGA